MCSEQVTVFALGEALIHLGLGRKIIERRRIRRPQPNPGEIIRFFEKKP